MNAIKDALSGFLSFLVMMFWAGVAGGCGGLVLAMVSDWRMGL